MLFVSTSPLKKPVRKQRSPLKPRPGSRSPAGTHSRRVVSGTSPLGEKGYARIRYRIGIADQKEATTNMVNAAASQDRES